MGWRFPFAATLDPEPAIAQPAVIVGAPMVETLRHRWRAGIPKRAGFAYETRYSTHSVFINDRYYSFVYSRLTDTYLEILVRGLGCRRTISCLMPSGPRELRWLR
jgi:hypothetical protein